MKTLFAELRKILNWRSLALACGLGAALACGLAPQAHAGQYVDTKNAVASFKNNQVEGVSQRMVGIVANISGSGTGFGVAQVSGTIKQVTFQVNNAQNVGGTSSTVTLKANGLTVTSASIPSTSTGSLPIIALATSNTIVTPGTVLQVSTSTGLTTTNTSPGNLLLNATVQISPTATFTKPF